MKLDYSALEKAMAQLEKSLAYLDSEMSRDDPELRMQFRAASIQAFGYTYELAVKMIRRQLEQIVFNPAELREMAFMDLIRSASEAGLVKDVLAYKVFREKRNITSHTYDDDKAEYVLSGIDVFIDNTRFLLRELKRRNA
ncbi:MAG: HI0074 family nucleotidyltransferase substrate-binding subunit [Euryarchaeota archaeon]|nr:HI0074 family nucleotidyltransferase substrate-binding subunit [Euryarchaeota archaeon]